MAVVKNRFNYKEVCDNIIKKEDVNYTRPLCPVIDDLLVY